jgi:hypothetical protein
VSLADRRTEGDLRRLAARCPAGYLPDLFTAIAALAADSPASPYPGVTQRNHPATEIPEVAA